MLVVSHRHLRITAPYRVKICVRSRLSTQLFRRRDASFGLPPNGFSLHLGLLPNRIPNYGPKVLTPNSRGVALHTNSLRGCHVTVGTRNVCLGRRPLNC